MAVVRTGTRARVVEASFNGLEAMLRAILAPMGILALKRKFINEASVCVASGQLPC